MRGHFLYREGFKLEESELNSYFAISNRITNLGNAGLIAVNITNTYTQTKDCQKLYFLLGNINPYEVVLPNGQI